MRLVSVGSGWKWSDVCVCVHIVLLECAGGCVSRGGASLPTVNGHPRQSKSLGEWVVVTPRVSTFPTIRNACGRWPLKWMWEGGIALNLALNEDLRFAIDGTSST